MTGFLLAFGLLQAPVSVAGQGLADFDYENLSLRGVALDGGYIFPSRVEPAASFGGRIDLGFLGPGVRVTAGFSRWSSFLTSEEVGRLEERLEELIDRQPGAGEPSDIDLGSISWSDVALNADVHLIWRVPLNVNTYAGIGATAHVLNGGGEAIQGTFVEDLLSTVRAGVNAHAGLEIPLHRRLRLVSEARYELLENLSYLQLRVGGQIMFGEWARGSARR